MAVSLMRMEFDRQVTTTAFPSGDQLADQLAISPRTFTSGGTGRDVCVPSVPSRNSCRSTDQHSNCAAGVAGSDCSEGVGEGAGGKVLPEQVTFDFEYALT